MINLIGAYIFGIVLLAVISQRPSLARFDAALRNLSSVTRFVMVVVITLIVVQHRFENFEGIWIISLPAWVWGTLNLWMHEAGHGFSFWANPFVQQFGGTAFELGIPLGISLYAFWRGYDAVVGLGLLWYGDNSIAVARYAADGAERSLPLLGGDAAGHDWGNMLTTLGLLQYDDTVGTIIGALGWIATVAGLAFFLRSGTVGGGRGSDEDAATGSA